MRVVKTIILAVVPVLLLLGLTPAKNSQGTGMDNFNWILGSWQIKTPRGVIKESWWVLDDSTFAGDNKLCRNTGETVLVETLTFSSRNGVYYYTPTMYGQNDNKPIPFRITSFTTSGFVSENPGHDFPKRIVYRLVNNDSIHAFIDGGEARPEKKADFYYSRVKN